MGKKPFVLASLALGLVVIAAASAAAQATANIRPVATPDGGRPTASPTDPGSPLPPFDPKTAWREAWSCDLFGPAEVQGYRIQCSGGTWVDFFISDGFVRGDHWELKGKNWDSGPNTGVTTCDGGVISYSVAGRVWNYGGTPSNPGNLDSYVECTYLHGVDLFGASAFVIFASDAPGCVVTPDPIRPRINRTP